MSCPKCVEHVKNALSQIPGIQDIDINLESGLVKLKSLLPIGEDLIKKAVEAAGYVFKK